MSLPHRGAYGEKPDAPTPFDPRQLRRNNRQRPITSIIVAGVSVGILVTIFCLYRARTPGDEPHAAAGDPRRSVQAAQGKLSTPSPSPQTYIVGSSRVAKPLPTLPQSPQAPRDSVTLRPKAAVPTTALASKPIPRRMPAETASSAPASSPSMLGARVRSGQTSSMGRASVVQVGAFPSRAQADEGWTAAVQAVPGLAAGKHKTVEAIEHNGQTLYRSAVTGFDTREEAVTFCSALQTTNKGCFVR
jgi:hypothetical protein